MPHVLVLGIVGFLTLVDLFATQAILPALASHYRVTPAAMGVAVNSTTLGMAVASLLVALYAETLGRRNSIAAGLALLAVPTSLLAVAPSLEAFAGLRIAQGLLMATAFTLTMAYVSEQLRPHETAGALAAYVTGTVASNLVGRLVAAPAADMIGFAASFFVFAGLNIAGAFLVWRSFGEMRMPESAAPLMNSFALELVLTASTASLIAAFAVGFLILFAFIGTFTYVNFTLVAPPVAIDQMSLGFVYLVFAPSLLTTPLAGRLVRRFGSKAVAIGGFVVAMAGLPLVAAPRLLPILMGLSLVAIGTFLAQAVATAHVAASAPGNRAVASGLYLASYYMGGLAGSLVPGRIFEAFGWTGCLAGIGVALGAAALLAARLDAASLTDKSLHPTIGR